VTICLRARTAANVNFLYSTGILVLLPAAGKDWDGHYTAEGCGGSCGSYAYMEQVAGLGSGLLGEDVVKRGWVSSGTDMGHENTPVYPFTQNLLNKNLTIARNKIQTAKTCSGITAQRSLTGVTSLRTTWLLPDKR
jgi:hypothetical protein